MKKTKIMQSQKCKALRESLSRFGKRRPSLVDLPVDIFLIIMEMTPNGTKLVLTETCKTFLWFCPTLKQSKAYSRADYLEYLTSKTRGSLEHWVCGWCMQLHRVSLSDSPRDIWAPCNCPKDPFWVFRRDYHAGNHTYALQHRHVQYALKCERFRGEGRMQFLSSLPWGHVWRYRAQQRLVERIMKPYHAKICVERFMDDDFIYDYSARPMISKGRFLVQFTWKYSTNQRGLWANRIGFIRICGHQFNCTHNPPGERWVSPESIPADRAQVNLGLTAWENAIQCFRYPLHGVANFFGHYTLPLLTIRKTRSVVHSHCDGCLTDFSVQTSDKHVTITSWQDFGGECSPLDAAWRSQFMGLGPGDDPNRSVVSHDRGSVRRRYRGLG